MSTDLRSSKPPQFWNPSRYLTTGSLVDATHAGYPTTTMIMGPSAGANPHVPFSLRESPSLSPAPEPSFFTSAELDILRETYGSIVARIHGCLRCEQPMAPDRRRGTSSVDLPQGQVFCFLGSTHVLSLYRHTMPPGAPLGGASVRTEHSCFFRMQPGLIMSWSRHRAGVCTAGYYCCFATAAGVPRSGN